MVLGYLGKLHRWWSTFQATDGVMVCACGGNDFGLLVVIVDSGDKGNSILVFNHNCIFTHNISRSSTSLEKHQKITNFQKILPTVKKIFEMLDDWLQIMHNSDWFFRFFFSTTRTSCTRLITGNDNTGN